MFFIKKLCKPPASQRAFENIDSAHRGTRLPYGSSLYYNAHCSYKFA